MGSYLTQHPHVIFIAAYVLGVIALNLYLSRFVHGDEDFFLAGRSLNKWIVAGTIMATDSQDQEVRGRPPLDKKGLAPARHQQDTRGGLADDESKLVHRTT